MINKITKVYTLEITATDFKHEVIEKSLKSFFTVDTFKEMYGGGVYDIKINIGEKINEQ